MISSQHTHVRFNINMPVLTSQTHLKRPYDTTTETKKTIIQNLCEGPETFFWLSYVFLLFGFRLNETIVVFLNFWWKTIKHCFFVFSAGSLVKTPKTLCCLISVGKQKNLVSLWRNPKMQEQTRKTRQNQTFRG